MTLSRRLLASGLAHGTHRTYATGQRNYLAFCRQYGITSPVPATGDTLCLWLAYLSTTLKFNTVRSYLQSVCTMHKENGFPDPSVNDPRVLRLYGGIKRDQGIRVTRQALAITTDMLTTIQSLLSVDQAQHRLMWAVMVTAVYGLFRIGELVSNSARVTSGTLLNGAVSFISTGDTTHLGPWSAADYHMLLGCSHFIVHLSHSKTDPFRAGVEVVVAGTVAVNAMASYLCFRTDEEGSLTAPLFTTGSTVAPLTRRSVIRFTKSHLHRAGITVAGAISFRRGGATSMAAAGISDALIKRMGRWRSHIYAVYVDASTATTLNAADRM